MPNEILALDGVSHWFAEAGRGRLEVLRNVNFTVQSGEWLTIVGPSGGGKSTLLRVIAGLLQPTRGKVTLRSRRLAMVFQNFGIFPWLSVEENIAFGLTMAGVSAAERAKTAREKIAEVGLSGFANKYPKELSGGMRQRVGIARALALQPDLLLMDEPFSSLDTFTAEKLRADVLALWQKYRMTVVMITHLVEEAVQLADRIIVLTKRPGMVKLVCPVDLPRPRNRRSEQFFALANRIAAQIEQ